MVTKSIGLCNRRYSPTSERQQILEVIRIEVSNDFDRLASAGFTPEDIPNVRRQFHVSRVSPVCHTSHCGDVEIRDDRKSIRRFKGLHTVPYMGRTCIPARSSLSTRVKSSKSAIKTSIPLSRPEKQELMYVPANCNRNDFH
jgi:hypothetical protein